LKQNPDFFYQRVKVILRPMRVVGEIPHPELKITIFHWNNRYLIKLEAGPFEQTFKIEEYDLSSEEEIKSIVNEEFIQQSIIRFNDMAKSLAQATQFL
jgi:hypothetical protein